jgi:hypothetical protein
LLADGDGKIAQSVGLKAYADRAISLRIAFSTDCDRVDGAAGGIAANRDGARVKGYRSKAYSDASFSFHERYATNGNASYPSGSGVLANRHGCDLGGPGVGANRRGGWRGRYSICPTSQSYVPLERGSLRRSVAVGVGRIRHTIVIRIEQTFSRSRRHRGHAHHQCSRTQGAAQCGPQRHIHEKPPKYTAKDSPLLRFVDDGARLVNDIYYHFSTVRRIAHRPRAMRRSTFLPPPASLRAIPGEPVCSNRLRAEQAATRRT